MPNVKKVSDDVLVEVYNKTWSVWDTAKEVGMCGQAVWERLKKIDALMPLRKPNKKQQFILENYTKYRDAGKLNELAEIVDMNKANICRYAKSRGLTDQKHKKIYSNTKEKSKKAKEYLEKNEHPRGMKGKKHSVETKLILAKKSKQNFTRLTEKQKIEKVFKMLKTKEKNGTFVNRRQKQSWKQGWRVVGDKRIYFRSRWEANYGRYLQFLLENKEIKSWEHEPDTFWFENIKRGVRSYLPDFKIIENNGETVYHEVKGWYDARSITKLKRMSKYYPEVKLKVIDAKWFKANKHKLIGLISGWED